MGIKIILPTLTPIIFHLMFEIVVSIFSRSCSAADIPQSVHHLGLVEGKDYYAEVDQIMNQTAGAGYCQTFGLNLASLENKIQADLVGDALRELGYASQSYWTSAKESRQSSMFVWPGTRAALDNSTVAMWNFPVGHGQHYCVLFYPYSGANAEFSVTTCNLEYRVLCHS